MNEKEKDLFVKDLCARLPYGVKVSYCKKVCTLDYTMFIEERSVAFGKYPMLYFSGEIEEVKPYLRPMSSMTDLEEREYNKLRDKIAVDYDSYGTPSVYTYAETVKSIDWLNEHHFDHRGLIPKKLALKAKDGMYESEPKFSNEQ